MVLADCRSQLAMFDDKLLESIINNMKLNYMRRLENNESRADMFVESFVNGTEWKDEVEKIDRLSKITKQEAQAIQIPIKKAVEFVKLSLCAPINIAISKINQGSK